MEKKLYYTIEFSKKKPGVQVSAVAHWALVLRTYYRFLSIIRCSNVEGSNENSMNPEELIYRFDQAHNE